MWGLRNAFPSVPGGRAQCDFRSTHGITCFPCRTIQPQRSLRGRDTSIKTSNRRDFVGQCSALIARLLYLPSENPLNTLLRCGRGVTFSIMDIQETQRLLSEYLHELADLFHRVPGSAIFLRYVKSSYQNDPIRSAVELFLFLFAVRYLLAPKYSTKPGVVQLSEDEIDDLVDEWTPEPLVGKPTVLEEMEVDKRTVIVG